jgi:hypothetical protein
MRKPHVLRKFGIYERHNRLHIHQRADPQERIACREKAVFGYI